MRRALTLNWELRMARRSGVDRRLVIDAMTTTRDTGNERKSLRRMARPLDDLIRSHNCSMDSGNGTSLNGQPVDNGWMDGISLVFLAELEDIFIDTD